MSLGEIITWPFAWLLMALYELTTNYGIAILIFALVIKLVLLPFQMKSKRSTMRTARLTPLMKELEKKCGDDKQRYQQEVARLYKEEHINPMSGCLWTLIPFPIIIALYSVIRQPLSRLMHVGADALEKIKEIATGLGYTVSDGAYSEIGLTDFVHKNFEKFSGISDKLKDIDFSFLGMNLGDTPQWNFFVKTDWSDPAIWGAALGLFLIPVAAAFFNYLAMKVSNAGNPQAQAQQGSMKGMMLMMPLVSLYFCFVMPAAIGIYWIAGSVFGIIQDAVLNKHFNKLLDIEDAERRERMSAREAELERKRQETERLRELGATKLNENTSKKKLQAKEKAEAEARAAAERARLRAENGEEAASQVGNRKYARGRAYAEDRFAAAGSETTATPAEEENSDNSETGE